MKRSSVFFILIFLISCASEKSPETVTEKYANYSGIYPHLAFYNSQGECGTGAVVPWAGKLWAITYSPHYPNGSDDKLYEIDEELNLTVRPESIGGTPANRMIHSESNQLFIGPYAIDSKGSVRALAYDQMMGRHTGNARHLTDPTIMIYYATMEEGFYEVNVNTLEVNTLYEDGHVYGASGQYPHRGPLLPGAHGKGLYSGQGVMVYSNNGETSEEARKFFDVESGVLAEWDGKDWETVRRNQFVEVTGPGGIYGNSDPANDPIWATGWDHKSLILGVREKERGWSFYRLPKASHSYDGAHGWNTEWPRIRNVGTEEAPDYLMTMHGMFWKFPGDFNSERPVGLRPRSAYLKVIGDFARWNDRLVFGCDDSAQREFLNKRSAKGGIEGPGQSNSNLWFTGLNAPDQLGPAHATGAVWLNEDVERNEASEPFLFAGWDRRILWISNHGQNEASITVELDTHGMDDWSMLKQVSLGAQKTVKLSFIGGDAGEWIRLRSASGGLLSAIFSYADEEKRSNNSDQKFAGLTSVENDGLWGGLLYGLGDNRRKLGISARDVEGNSTGYYELDSTMQLGERDDPEMQQFIESKFAIPKDVLSVDESSVLIVDDSQRRWRLPKTNDRYTELIGNSQTRICREVATERDLFHCHGTFYELPAENADGFAKIRPIASHRFRIHDYASYRGMLILSGIDPATSTDNHHIIRSTDGKLALWAGVIDDLWKLGKPVGVGGPWKNALVKANIPSDPYLIGYYDQRSAELSHDDAEPVTFRFEVNPIGHGPWMEYQRIVVKPGETEKHVFPSEFEARWIRIVADRDCKATAWFTYK